MDRERVADTLRRQGTLAGVGVNVLGAVLVLLYLGVVFPPREPADVFTLTVCLPLAIGYVAIATVLGIRRGRRLGAPLQAWLRAGRRPTAEECRDLMRLPLREMRMSIMFWLAAIPVWSLIALDYSPRFAVEVGVTIALAALTVGALDYLLFEKLLRPAVALALDQDSPPEARSLGIGARSLLTWVLCSGVPVLMIALIPAGRTPDDAGDLLAPIWFVSVIALIAGFLTVKLTTNAVTNPIRELRRALDAVAEGRLDVTVRVDDGSEIGRLQAGFNGMVEDLRERERLRELYGRAVGDDVAREALERGARLGGDEREVTTLFVDIIGSTALAQREPPAKVVELLNAFFAEVVDVVHAHGGLVNKFEGDAAMCVFGVPAAQPDHAARGLAAARALRRRLDTMAARLDVAMGVAHGVAVAGYVGAESRFEYTVIGDPVNEASRLTELAKRHPGRLLASAEAVRAAGGAEAAAWREDGEVVLRGRRAPTRLAIPVAPPARAARPAAGEPVPAGR